MILLNKKNKNPDVIYIESNNINNIKSIVYSLFILYLVFVGVIYYKNSICELFLALLIYIKRNFVIFIYFSKWSSINNLILI